MSFQVTIGQYYPGNSLLHRLDPRVKITGVFLLSIAIFLPRAWPGHLAAVLFTLALVALGRVPLKQILRGLRPILIFLVITALFNLFLTPGEELFRIGPAVATREGLRLVAVTSTRLLLLVTIASILTLTTSPIRLTDGLEMMLRPLRPIGVPAHELALMMTIALRFIPTLAEEADRIMRAQQARGASFATGSLVSRIRSLVPVLVPLFVAAFRRADELATAMEARGYRGGEGRTRMKELTFTARDAVALVVLIGFVALMVVMRIGGVG
ncbi:energy-coupling factor transporter transmembrane component T family protein [Symbiobacterium thermophilum]|uniref:energy-coupling factor transporter transmembrane component T family protein n=1 Tax=Symbiobacterium thermophilum TaxID=2734 RepID=UPI0035C6E1B5